MTGVALPVMLWTSRGLPETGSLASVGDFVGLVDCADDRPVFLEADFDELVFAVLAEFFGKRGALPLK